MSAAMSTETRVAYPALEVPSDPSPGPELPTQAPSEDPSLPDPGSPVELPPDQPAPAREEDPDPIDPLPGGAPGEVPSPDPRGPEVPADGS